jgi:polygalacturonase
LAPWRGTTPGPPGVPSDFAAAPNFAVLAIALALWPLAARAQDTRAVSEPVIPPVCAPLSARLAAVDGRTLAPGDERKPDTARIQQALDGCPAGQAVELNPDGAFAAFLAGPLQLRAGVTLLVAKGAILFGSRDPREYDAAPGSCGIVNAGGRGCLPMISGSGVANAAVMGDGVIDGRGWAPLLGQTVSWWDLAQQAKARNANQNCPRILVLNRCDNFTLYRITLKNSPNFHVAYNGGNGFTAWGVTIDTPKAGRNTDGIDPGNSTNVTITHCFINAGDDNVAVKAGPPGPTAHITISHNHFYGGHGVSIGSETDGGLSDMLVTDLSIDGADNGIRIKSNSSRGGLVKNVVYEDVCIRDTRNPILMDTHYPFRGAASGRLPWFTDIVLRNVRVYGPGKITLEGFDRERRLGIAFDNVVVDDLKATKFVSGHATVKLGPGPVNFRPRGEDVIVEGASGEGRPNSCQAKFVPMPGK